MIFMACELSLNADSGTEKSIESYKLILATLQHSDKTTGKLE
ncbi:MAG: hypothetical protein ACI8Z1_000774 [Candidatus Azotimanducaceae bacterium]|jgi:hypothetical protein